MQNNEKIIAALESSSKIIETARRYFPKSIRNHDTFQLNLTAAEVSKALEEMKSCPA